jgi:DUF1680 family protein
MRVLQTVLLTGVLTVMFEMAAFPQPKIVVDDKEKLLPPSQVKMSGFLQERVINNEKNWLLTRDEEILLGGFERRPGTHPWIGEHVGKWLHASCLSWIYTQDEALKKKMDRVVRRLLATQQPDGYMGTYSDDEHWTSWDVWVHKYCLIGLMSYYEVTGDKAALAGAARIGDLLTDTFGPEKRDIIKSGTHVGMAATSVMEPMMLLFKATGKKEYLAFCEYLVKAYDQPHGPKIIASLLEKRSVHETANGKAYEMMSNLVGLCELYRYTGNEKYLRAAEIAWDDIVRNRMYLTGGTSLGEHFQEDHYLPRTGAVAETCATVTWLQQSIQLLRLTGESKYADVIERIVYNHLLAAQKPTGEAFCYFTPLEGKKPYRTDTCCCTSSGPRGVALIPTVAYGIKEDGIAVNLYESGSVVAKVAGGTNVRISQETDYPFSGKVVLTVSPEKAASFTLYLRTPEWCRRAFLGGNGLRITKPPQPGKYASIAMTWPKEPTTVTLDMAVDPWMTRGGHGDEGFVAIQRGPFVLAADAALNPEVPSLQFVFVDYAGGTPPVRVQERDGDTLFSLSASALKAAAGKREFVPTKLLLTTFADAGGDGSSFRVWLRDRGSFATAALSLFAFGKEEYSRKGNLEGLIADEDAATLRVTFDGKRSDEDWYAVKLEKPVKMNRVVFMHGRSFHDGGWFDASASKPKIQILRKRDGEWETVAELTSYPETSATDNRKIEDSKAFSMKIEPVETYGLRIVGKPAHGDNPNQAFSSCAELQGFLDE